MSTVQVRTADLIGPALDLAVAKATGVPLEFIDGKCLVPWGNDIAGCSRNGTTLWRPSTEWSQGGPLIEKFHVQTSFNGCGFSRSPTGEYWCAYVCKDTGEELHPSGGGPSPLIAACRAIVRVRIPRHSDTQPTLIRTPVPRSFGQAVEAQRRRGGIVSPRCPASSISSPACASIRP